MSSASSSSAENTSSVEQWKLKQLIRDLEKYEGAGTSMISLIIPPVDQISRVQKMLTTEAGTASNIKSRVNRQSVTDAIAAVQQRLKAAYQQIPPNGLIMYCGLVNDKKIMVDFEPFKPINTSIYLCDSKFHLDALRALLQTDVPYGFIIVDGNGALFATLEGNVRKILHKFSVELPNKQGRGGQSANRFARIRDEKCTNFVRKVAEMSTQCFITNDVINVRGLIVAGCANYKTRLVESNLFDQRLRSKVISIVDVAYGGLNGLNEAIHNSAASIDSMKFQHEQRILSKYFQEIAQDTGKICFGMRDLLCALEQGAVESVIVWEDLKDTHAGVNIVDWMTSNYKSFGTTLEIISDKTPEGNQFCKGFCGIGGLLRYRMSFDLDGVEGPVDLSITSEEDDCDNQGDKEFNDDDQCDKEFNDDQGDKEFNDDQGDKEFNDDFM